MQAVESISLINGLIQEADAVRQNRNTFEAWRRKCRVVLDRIFGDDSQQSSDLMAIKYSFHGIRSLGDNGPVIRAFENGLEKAKEVLRSFIWEIERLGVQSEEQDDDPRRVIKLIELICARFHSVARQIRQRHDDRPTLDVVDEYDVQDLLHTLLRLYFEDVRAEEWTPSYAGSASRMDFLLKNEQIVIEVKKTRKGLDAKKVGEELILDIAHYRSHPNCKTLICFVYDPENRITNPVGLESDLARTDQELSVIVVISPKG